MQFQVVCLGPKNAFVLFEEELVNAVSQWSICMLPPETPSCKRCLRRPGF